MLIEKPSNRSRQRQGIGFLVADTARRLRSAFAGRLQGTGLTLAQARVLLHVAREPGMRQVELADLLEVAPITLARLMDRLEGHGLVERRPDESDGRAYRIFATHAADATLAAIEEVSDALVREALHGIGAGDEQIVAACLQRMRANLARLPSAEAATRRAAR
jgi:DNA-binding MarR family transcriptional regulator